MLIETLSTFPEMFSSVMGASMMRIAQEKNLLTFAAHNLRDWTHDAHRTTDDNPYGGGAGLVMKCEPIFEAYRDICEQVTYASHADGTGKLSNPKTIFLSPCGKVFSDSDAKRLSTEEHLLFICGHYEGIDERVYTLADEIFSIGDYVLTSGELASMVIIDAVVRQIPGVLGDEQGPVDESFNNGLLEYPQYTRPANFEGMKVPEVLLSGNHAEIAKWRHQMQLIRTRDLRPDLLTSAELSPSDLDFLQR